MCEEYVTTKICKRIECSANTDPGQVYIQLCPTVMARLPVEEATPADMNAQALACAGFRQSGRVLISRDEIECRAHAAETRARREREERARREQETRDAIRGRKGKKAR